jgi:uncharacterized membrane protein
VLQRSDASGPDGSLPRWRRWRVRQWAGPVVFLIALPFMEVGYELNGDQPSVPGNLIGFGTGVAFIGIVAYRRHRSGRPI